ncbi:MAG: A/G-specific adenine glycosylase [Gaiellales bacterium]|jgi:A/G-specific adenine glycosylase|nr:A/G-specific adenine glycosylase [Gaiellales bacterium]
MHATTREAMQDAVLTWYSQNGRDHLPWRHTRDPYAILVSEVMLQQTQVSRVLPRYQAWLTRWPTARGLASAELADVIRAWDGLGYNRRAVSLHRCATIAAERGGFPREPADLRRLPGIGPYTAAAIACFAFGAQVPAPDTNARRVLGRAFGDPDVAPPPGRAYEWNQALFDLGSTVCIARRPRCQVCPLADGCPSRGMTFEPIRRQKAFEGSFRQRRSRLLKRLADGAVELDALDVPALEALVGDGLAVVDGDRARLP